MTKQILSEMIRVIIFVIVVRLAAPSAGFSQHAVIGVTNPQIELAIRRALALLERTSGQTADSRSCFTCHRQALPSRHWYKFEKKGFRVDRKPTQRQLSHTHEHQELGREDNLEGNGQGGQVDTLGYVA